MIQARYNQQEIKSPKGKYIALLADDKSGYFVHPIENSETGDNVDTDYQIGWISHTTSDEGFYLHEVTVTNFKVDLPDLHNLLKLCCTGCY